MDRPERSAALLEAVLDAAVDAILLADENGVITSANLAASEIFERSIDELIGESVNVVMPSGFANLQEGCIRKRSATSDRAVVGAGCDVDGFRRDGSLFPLHLTVGVTHVDGKRTFVAILHDLTHRMAMQNALSRSQRLDAVGQMTGGIAHDFNNLLTVIIGNLELLQMQEVGEASESLIKDALETAEMGADLTSRLLVFARRSNLKPIEADLSALCEDALAILKRTLGAQIRISTDFAPGTRHVMVDPVQLQSALVNLALNARDAMNERGELLISVDNVTIDDDYMAQEIDVAVGDYVRLSVSDNGAGMDMEAQRRAFEPFFTTKPERGGTGLGLATVYGFVRQSGGHVTLYSEPGLGTSFGLYFPALPEATKVIEGSETTGQSALDEEFGKGLTVLIVEDNPRVRRLSVARIAGLGFKTEEAPDGDTAYEMLKGGLKADVLFSDLVMPGHLNGYDLAARVAGEFPQIRIMLTSGYASDVIAERMANGVRYEILHKPFRQSELIQRLQALLAEDPSA